MRSGWWSVWIVIAGCGGAPTRPTGPDGTWHAHAPTLHASCGVATPMCADAASLLVRWPDDARAPDGARLVLDGAPIDPAEAELGVCASVGTHVVRAEASLPRSIDIVPGAETRVVLSRTADGGLSSETSLGTIDVPAMVAALATADLPTIAYDARPEERRVFGPVLAAAFDAWRARLARVHEIATSRADAVLIAACEDHDTRSRGIAITIAEERPSADRLAAIHRAMETEIAAAGTMVPVERECPLFADEADRDPTPVTVQVRPFAGDTTSVVRIRVAIDDVEVLDTGAPRAAELFEHAIADGVVPPGDHVVFAEVTFADRGGLRPRRPVIPQMPIHVGNAPVRVVVRALGNGTVEIVAL